VKDDIFEFFAIQRNIFGICPHSGDLFRLSDCKIYLETKPTKDWLDLINRDDDRITRAEEKLDEIEETMRETARKRGRRLAQQRVRRIDRVFTPRRLNPDDAKVIFHPVDYVVFKGMKSNGPMEEIVFLDRDTRSPERRRIQRSIEQVLETERYEWMTVRIREDGTIKEEH
jgi:predicted Holliday junction resolvase-like endonuclease